MGEVPALNHAFTVAQQSKLSRQELEILEKRQMFLHDNRNALLKAKQDGEKMGVKMGEKRKALEVAQRLIGGLDVETIAQTTGLTIAEVQQLIDG
jgi:predicted transposase/invertase (TIGR01784 family)